MQFEQITKKLNLLGKGFVLGSKPNPLKIFDRKQLQEFNDPQSFYSNDIFPLQNWY